MFQLNCLRLDAGPVLADYEVSRIETFWPNRRASPSFESQINPVE